MTTCKFFLLVLAKKVKEDETSICCVPKWGKSIHTVCVTLFNNLRPSQNTRLFLPGKLIYQTICYVISFE